MVNNFLLSTSSRPALGSTQTPIQRVPGAISPGVKRPGREGDHSPPTSAEAKKIWMYISTPPYAFMAYAQLVKHRDNFTFTLFLLCILKLNSYSKKETFLAW
jgi:hypothetical protein